MALTRKARAASRAATATPSEAAELLADLLADVPLFAGVSTRNLRKIARQAIVSRFDPKAPIVNAGEPGEAFYVILSGRATVRRRGRPKTELGPGAYFGEMALLDGTRRTATVVAETETVCLILARKAFAKILKEEPAVTSTLLRTLAARVRELEALPAD
jgi:voltage-gated potassium channel